MFYQISLLLFLAGRASAAYSLKTIYTDNFEQQKILWGKFKSDHSKFYETATEEKHRFDTFLEQLKHVDHLNQEAVRMEGNPVFGINKFSDLSPDEFKRMYLSSQIPDASELKVFNSSPNLSGPRVDPGTSALVDWTGRVTIV